MIGRTLLHYRILDRLGAGGMGEVYRAEDTRLGRRVAIKVLSPAVASDSQALDRFRREARAVASLNHPGVVTIHAVEEAEGVLFLAMELVEGASLETLIPTGGLTLERFFELALPLAGAVAAAHASGITHRDLKPANVMVTADGRVKVLDFGLAKLTAVGAGADGEAATLTRSGQVMGTVPYMSPEQLKGQPVDERTDVFSLGVVLYEMLSGERPFRGESSADVLSAILRDTPRPPLGAIPAMLWRLVERCLEKDKERRLSSATELAAALGMLAREATSEVDATVATRSPQFGGPAARPARRPRRAVWVAGVALLAAVGAAVGLWWRSTGVAGGSAGGAAIGSLAVLPFSNLSGDPAQEVFADGMTDALINELAQIGALKVISRGSVMRLKGSDRAPRELARQLGVEALVEGSALRSGDRVSISAQLVDGVSEQLRWSASFERHITDVLELRKEVARAIAGEIEVALTPEDERRLVDTRKVDPAVFDATLRGWHLWNGRFDPGGLQLARDTFEEAVALDPTYAPAWAGLANTFVGLEVTRALPAREAMPLALAAARRALELDERVAEAHTSLSLVLWDHDWDWKEAEREVLRAIELNPSYATAHQWHGILQAMAGRGEPALAAIRKAQSLDPLSLLIRRDVGFVFALLGRYEEAIAELEASLALDPTFTWARRLLGEVQVEAGRVGDGIANLERAVAEEGTTSAARGPLAWAYAVAGRRDEARVVLAELEEQSASGVSVARIELALGEREKALASLERAVEERDSALVLLRQNRAFDDLRGEQRFDAIIGALGYPS